MRSELVTVWFGTWFCYGGALCVSLQWSSDDQGSMLRRKTSLPTNQFTRSYKRKDSSCLSFLEFLVLLLGGLEGWSGKSVRYRCYAT
jgi:hypothetical protein